MTLYSILCTGLFTMLTSSTANAQSDARSDILNSLRGQVTLPESPKLAQQPASTQQTGANNAIDLSNLPIKSRSGDVARVMQAREQAEQAARERVKAEYQRRRAAEESERLAQQEQRRREQEERDWELAEIQDEYAKQRARDSARTWDRLSRNTTNSPHFIYGGTLSSSQPSNQHRLSSQPEHSTPTPSHSATRTPNIILQPETISTTPLASLTPHNTNSSRPSPATNVAKSKSKVYEPMPEVTQGNNDNWWGDRDHAIYLARLGAVNDISAQCSAKGARVDRPNTDQIKSGSAPVRWSFSVPDCQQGGWQGKEWKCKVEVAGTCYRM